MITVEESGLTQAAYDEVKAAITSPAWQVIAHRFNLLWSDMGYTGTGTGFTGQGFDAIASGSSYIFRTAGYTLERMDPATGEWTELSAFDAPTNPISHAYLAEAGGTLYAFAITNAGIERRSSNDLGATWDSWATILANSSTTVYSDNRLVNGTPSASSGNAARGFDNAWNSVSQCWKTTSGATGILTYDRGVGNAFVAKRYRIYPDAKAYPYNTGFYVWDSQKGAMVPQIINYAKDSPKNWTFQGSNNGTDWDTLDTQTNQTGWIVGRTVASYTFTNATAYRYYRLNVTANQGGTLLGVGELQAFEEVDGQAITHLAPVSPTRVHFVYQDLTKKISDLRLTEYDGSWNVFNSDIWWPFPVASFDAESLNGDDVLVLQSNIPGMYKFENGENNTVLAQVYSAGGLAVFTCTNQSWSGHRMIDQIDALSDAHYFQNVRIQNLNGTLWVTAYTSSGSDSFPITGYRQYTSKDGKWWSFGHLLCTGEGSSGIALIQIQDYVYALEEADVFRSQSTPMTGYSTLQADVTVYLDDYSISRSAQQQPSFTLDNASGWLDSHAWFNEDNTIMLEHRCGYDLPFEEEFLMEDEISDLVAGVDSIPRMVQIGTTELKVLRRSQELPEYLLPCSALDRTSWMTSKYASENGFLLDGQIVGPDDYTARLDTNYGGLAHTAAYAGEWKVVDEILLPVGVGDNLGFSTFGDRIWNGDVQVGYSFGQTTAGNWAGVVFRAVDASNLYSVMIDRSGALGLWQRVDGSWTLLDSVNLADRVVDTTYYLRARFFYSTIEVYTSGNGITWTQEFTYQLDYSTRETGTPYLYPLATTSFDLGFTGVYGKLSAATSIVRFSHFRVYDLNEPLILEDAFRAFGNLARIHDFQFDDLYSAVVEDWTLDSGLSLSISGDTLTLSEDAYPTSPAGYTDDLTEGGIATASSTNLGSPEAAFDGSTGLWQSAPSSLPAWLAYRFTSPIRVKRYTITSTNPASYSPHDWTLQYWDGSDWQIQDTQTDITFGVSETKTFDVSGVPALSNQWRFYITATGAGAGDRASIAEAEMMDAGREYKAIQISANLPSSHVLRYRKATLAHAVFIAYQDADNYYRVSTNDIGKPEVIKVTGGTPTTLFAYSGAIHFIPASALMEISFHQFAASSQGDEWWAIVSMIANDIPVATYMDRLTTPLESPLQFGLVLDNASTMILADFSIPELATPIPTLLLDPGEKPIAGLSRAVEGVHTRFFCRYDGTLRAWKPKVTASAHTFLAENIEGNVPSFDEDILRTHIRLIGAYTEADFARTGLIERHGHKFEEVTNSSLMTPQECYQEAERMVQRSEEAALEQVFRHSYSPLLEPEDHITTPDGERIITAMDWTFTPAQVEQTLTCRKYVYGS